MNTLTQNIRVKGKTRTTIFAAIIGATSLIMTAHANSLSPEAMDTQAQKILNTMRTNPPSIIRSFEGPSGMRGHVLRGSQDDTSILVWQTADGNHLMMGNLYDHAGRDLTALAGRHFSAANPVEIAIQMAIRVNQSLMESIDQHKTDQPQLEDLGYYNIDDVETAIEAINSIPEQRMVNAQHLSYAGDDAVGTVYIYVDPSCQFCHKLFEEIKRYQWSEAKLKIMLIPVGILGTPSSNAAAKSLISNQIGDYDDTLSLLNGNVKNAEDLDVDPLVIANVMLNEQILTNTMMPATPSVVIDIKGNSQQANKAMVGPTASVIANVLKEAGIDVQIVDTEI